MLYKNWDENDSHTNVFQFDLDHYAEYKLMDN
jgi:hypothetical protein